MQQLATKLVCRRNLHGMPSSSSSSVTSQASIDLFRPRPIVSSNVFPVVFVHLIYNSALFLASCCCCCCCCCCPFLLHIVANFICMFLVSGQPVLLPALPKFLHSFHGQKNGVPVCSTEIVISVDINRNVYNIKYI